MKSIFIALLLITSFAKAQTKDFQSGKYHIIVDLSTTNIQPSSTNALERYDIRTGNTEGSGNLLMTVIEKRIFYFNAIPALANITQIGTTGAWNITIPTTITNQKSIFIPDKFTAIKFDATNYNIDLAPLFFPVRILKQSDGSTVCTIYEDGNIMWSSQSAYTAAAISTTGLIQYTIN